MAEAPGSHPSSHVALAKTSVSRRQSHVFATLPAVMRRTERPGTSQHGDGPRPLSNAMTAPPPPQHPPTWCAAVKSQCDMRCVPCRHVLHREHSGAGCRRHRGDAGRRRVTPRRRPWLCRGRRRRRTAPLAGFPGQRLFHDPRQHHRLWPREPALPRLRDGRAAPHGRHRLVSRPDAVVPLVHAPSYVSRCEPSRAAAPSGMHVLVSLTPAHIIPTGDRRNSRPPGCHAVGMPHTRDHTAPRHSAAWSTSHDASANTDTTSAQDIRTGCALPPRWRLRVAWLLMVCDRAVRRAGLTGRRRTCLARSARSCLMWPRRRCGRRGRCRSHTQPSRNGLPTIQMCRRCQART